MYKSIIRPFLFAKSPENAHHFTFRWVKRLFKLPGAKTIANSLYNFKDESLVTECFGLKFPNPVGLAAGFDKDAVLFNELASFGFGFIEIGTLTPVGQPGNPQPRLFRLPQDESLINRMGFNNGGAEDAIERLKKRSANVIIGGNIGKNKITPNEEAVEDYKKCFHALYDHVDYFVVNVSSPNTPNLRALQEKEPLKALLQTLQEERKSFSTTKPILLKIAPDLTDEQLDDIIEIMEETKLEGLIATNTTISRDGLNTSDAEIDAIGPGGLSGKAVKVRSTEVIRYLSTKSAGAFPIVGVGGIQTAEDAIEKLEAGASLVQVYSGFIYEGPSMLKKINKGIVNWKQRNKAV